jgi:hypothetical protein
MKTNTTLPPCECCGEPIKGTPYIDQAVGIVDADCGYALRDATKRLNKAGMRNVFLGETPDDKKDPS